MTEKKNNTEPDKNDLGLITAFGRRRSDLTAVKAIGNVELITHGGKQGLFTPLTDEEHVEESEQNLQQIVLAMREHVLQLENDKRTLQQELEAMRNSRTRTPDDFSTAISHSLDSLQARLHEMKNPVSRFAVKEFNVDVKVHAEVTELGTVEYRFLTPEDSIDPNRLTNIQMRLVPLPKEDDSGTWRSPAFTPMVALEEIQGIGDAYSRKLAEHQLYTISDLLAAGSRVRSKMELASMLDVDRQRLGEWMAHAELMTVRDIDGRAAEVLHAIGIDNLSQLAEQESEPLAERYNAQVRKMGHEVLKERSESEIDEWIHAAQTYVGVSRRGSAS